MLQACHDYGMKPSHSDNTVRIEKGYRGVLAAKPSQHDFLSKLDLDLLELDVQFLEFDDTPVFGDYKLIILLGADEFSATSRKLDRKEVEKFADDLSFEFVYGTKTLIELPDEYLTGDRGEIFKISISITDWNRRGVQSILEGAYESRNLSE